VPGTNIGCHRTSGYFGIRIVQSEFLMYPDAHPIGFLESRRILRKKLTTSEAQLKIFWHPFAQLPQRKVVRYCLVFRIKLSSFDINHLCKLHSQQLFLIQSRKRAREDFRPVVELSTSWRELALAICLHVKLKRIRQPISSRWLRISSRISTGRLQRAPVCCVEPWRIWSEMTKCLSIGLGLVGRLI
jgi:hypothetical protein